MSAPHPAEGMPDPMSNPLLNVLAKVGSILPSTPVNAPREYSGLEFRWKLFVFRPAEFKQEAIILGVLGLYLLLHLIGRWINMTRMSNTFKRFDPFLKSQFSAVRAALSSGPALHLVYASGRRNVLSLHSTLTLLPLHDLFGLLWQFGMSLVYPSDSTLEEGLLCDLTLGEGERGLQGEGLGVWAIVDKGEMRAVMEKRWDMTFPKLQQNQPSVPITHALFTEHSDITDLLLKTPNLGINELINNAQAAKVLKYFLISDVSPLRPTKGPLPVKFRSRHVVVSLVKPSSATETAAVQAWMQVALNVADFLAKPNLLKPDVSRKLVKTRATVDDDLQSAYAKDVAEENPQETAEEKRLAKKKAQRAGLSEKERQRLDDLEKKREARKMQKRQAMSGKMQ